LKIGIAGPVSLEPLFPWLPVGASLPPVYSFPLIGRLAAGLLSRGHAVTVFAGSEKIAKTEKWQGTNLEIVICPRRAARNGYDFYRFERQKLNTAMQESGVDLIHAHWCYEFAAAALVSRRNVLVTAHDCPNQIARFFRWTTAYPHWVFRSWLGARVCRQATHLTCVSPYVEKNIRRYTNSHAEVSVIPNGVPVSLFEAGKVRSLKAAPPGPCRIVTVLEGFGLRKNATVALRAFREVQKVFPEAELHMYGGDFESGGPAESWARSQGCLRNVCFRGRLPQPELHGELASSAALFLHPALEESHPMAVIEAMALGVPVIGGKQSGGVPFTLNQGQAGTLTDMTNPKHLAQTLRDLLSDSQRRQHLARAGWDYAWKHFREDEMIDKYIKAYEEVIFRRRG